MWVIRGRILWREGGLRQLTDDHSLVGELVRRGQLTPAQAAVHPHRSVITRALGTDGEVKPDIFPISLEPGDHLLICSDGLSGMVSEAGHSPPARRGDDPQAIAQSLVEAALDGGGEDNVTVVVLVVDEDVGGRTREARRTLRAGSWLRRRSRCSVRSVVRRPGASKASVSEGLERVRGWVADGGVGWSSWRWPWLLVVLVALGGTRALQFHRLPRGHHRRTVSWPSTTACHNTFLGWRMYSLVEVGSTPYAALRAVPQGPGRHPRAHQQGGGAAVRPQPRRAALSTRNKELLLLFPAILLTTIGFATVYIRRSEDLSTGSRSPTAPSSSGCSGWCMWPGVCWCRGRTPTCCPSPPCSPPWGS